MYRERLTALVLLLQAVCLADQHQGTSTSRNKTVYTSAHATAALHTHSAVRLDGRTLTGVGDNSVTCISPHTSHPQIHVAQS